MAIFKHSPAIHSWVNNLVFRLNSFVNVSFTNIPQIWERPPYFCTSEEQSYCSHTRRLRFRHFKAVGSRNSFWILSWKEKEIWTKKIHHVYWLTIGYLWPKNEGSLFSKHVPHFSDFTRWSGKFALDCPKILLHSFTGETLLFQWRVVWVSQVMYFWRHFALKFAIFMALRE